MEQGIGFVKVAGLTVAYASHGEGPPLVFPPGSFGHLALEMEVEPMRAFYDALASSFTLVRYDRPGTGMSDRDRPPETFTLEFEVDVLEALSSVLDLGRFRLFGFSYGAAVAAAFAARRPERIRRLLLYGAFADGSVITSQGVLRSVTDLLRANWQLGSRLLAEAFLPEADRDLAGCYARLRRESATGETAAALLELWARADLRDILGQIAAPTLVLHREDDEVVPMKLGRAVAALVPDARFEALEGRWHQPWMGDVGAVLQSAAQFLGFTPPAPWHRQSDSDSERVLTAREAEVLRLVAEGLSDSSIAQRLVLSAHTVHRHVANIRTRLGQPSRAAAAAHAIRHGLI
jgi:pimeloyl-ACP methyl ester carboxylesterase/DNA-binding CsgD family transcriptional regulator